MISRTGGGTSDFPESRETCSSITKKRNEEVKRANVPGFAAKNISSFLIHMLSFIFFTGRHSPPDMAFGFIQIQHFSRLPRKLWINLFQTLRYVFMFRCYYLGLFYFHIFLSLKCFHLIPNRLVNEGKYPHCHLCLLRFS